MRASRPLCVEKGQQIRPNLPESVPIRPICQIGLPKGAFYCLINNSE
ncbi:MAG: hypothetical protein OXT03_00330 [Alphaproteobacteria bacterium]|nr:hypothetical protein [Alphaproteobacteria bacterium]